MIWLTHMKKTIDIADPLAERLKQYAKTHGVTLREVVERALTLLLAETGRRKQRFVLRDASVDGQGLTREFSDAGWETIRTAIYETSGALRRDGQ